MLEGRKIVLYYVCCWKWGGKSVDGIFVFIASSLLILLFFSSIIDLRKKSELHKKSKWPRLYPPPPLNWCWWSPSFLSQITTNKNWLLLCVYCFERNHLKNYTLNPFLLATVTHVALTAVVPLCLEAILKLFTYKKKYIRNSMELTESFYPFSNGF